MKMSRQTIVYLHWFSGTFRFHWHALWNRLTPQLGVKLDNVIIGYMLSWLLFHERILQKRRWDCLTDWYRVTLQTETIRPVLPSQNRAIDSGYCTPAVKSAV